MNLTKHLALCGATAALLSSCYYDDYGTNGYGAPNQQQVDAYGNPTQGTYGGGTYGQPQPQQPAQSGYGVTPPSGYGSESGDVVTYPGDSGGGATAYDGSTTTGSGYSAPATTPSSSGRNYTVQKGDNLYRIGKKYGVSMQEIIRANGISDTTIHPGQELIIP